jgi:arabinose-5-phosphate isomerase
MSRKRFGIAGVTDGGKLVGVVSDGDLRRLLERDGPTIMSDTAADAMGRSPKTIAKEAWATEALRIMEERKITSLFVIAPDGRPEGILHLHDLWGVESI